MDFLDLMNRFVRIHNQFSAVKRGQICSVKGEKLYPAEIHILSLLKRNSGFSVSEIAESLYTTRSAASQMVKKLVAKGFLKKIRNPQNERALILSVTGKGNEAITFFLKSEKGSLSGFVEELSQMSSEELEMAKGFLSRLERMFDEKLKG